MTKSQSRIVLTFGLLIIFCASMMICGNFLGPSAGERLSEAGSEGLKVSISALVGALSALIGSKKE